MTKTWFTSDHHFGHRNIITFCDRPFDDPDAMDDDIIARHNSLVAPDDIVFFLGDVAMGRIADTLPKVKRMHGTKFLIPGNHDRVFDFDKLTDHHKDRWGTAYADAGFILIGDDHDGFPFTLSHFPFDGDSHDIDRFVDHRPPDHGGWHVHGHVHDEWRVRGRMINVGIDAWGGFPVSLDAILGLMADGPADLPAVRMSP